MSDMNLFGQNLMRFFVFCHNRQRKSEPRLSRSGYFNKVSLANARGSDSEFGDCDKIRSSVKNPITKLFYVLSLIFCCLINVAHATHKNEEYYRSFWNPKYHGKLLDYCLVDKKQCGTIVADQYCKMMGYDNSTQSTIAYNVGLTNYLDTCIGCKGLNCNGFMRITCSAKTRHKPIRDYYFRMRKYVFPRFNNYRIDWCYENGHGCGKRAAFSFCRRMGYMRESAYIKESNVAATKALGNQRLCFGKDCNAFKSITCYR